MVTLFLIVYCLGAAAVAAWIDVRCPSLRPRSVRRMTAVIVGGVLVAPVLPGLGHQVTSSAVLFIMVPCFAALVLCFLVLVWTARFCAALVGR